MTGWRTTSAALMVVLAVAASGCSDDETSAPGQESPETESSQSSPPSSAATPESTLPPSTEARFDRRLRIPDGPDWMAAGFGSLWVKRDNGAVERVSPEGKSVATIDADIFQQPVCQGIGVTSTAVWACATAGTLIRIDPATNEFATVSVPKINEQGRLTASGGLVWVLTGDGDRLEGLSDRGRLEATIELGTYCTDTADTANAGALWVACPYDGLVLRVDLEARKVTGQVAELPHAASVSVSGDIWVGYDEGLARIDPSALEVVSSLPLDVVGLRAADGGVWVRGTGDGLLTLVKSGTGEATTRLAATEVASEGDVIQFDGSWWVTANEENMLLRLSR